MIFNDENFPPLPASWTTVRVDEACTLVTIREKIKTKNYLNRGSLAVVDQGSALVGGYANDASKVVETTLPVVVFGDHTRALKFVDFPFAAGADGIKVLRPSASLHPRLVFRFLEAIKLPDRGYGRHFQHFRGSRIPVPPLDEQGRIADKLDAVLARVDACRDRLDRVPGVLKRFRQAVLEAATSGVLTNEWRSERDRDFCWTRGTLSSLLDGKPRNGYSPRAVEYPTPVKSLTLTATTSGHFRGEFFKYIDEAIPPNSHLWLCPGDILVQRANTLQYVGVSAIYDGPVGVFIYPDLMMKARANPHVLPKFLLRLLSSAAVRRHFRDNATGTAGNMPKINQETVTSAIVSWPEIDEQAEIVRRVESLFTWADRLEARHAAARAQVERLTPSLLAKAFRGELVPQDPADEPASELLMRLTQQPSANPNAPVKRQGPKPHHAKASQAASNVREESSS